MLEAECVDDDADEAVDGLDDVCDMTDAGGECVDDDEGRGGCDVGVCRV